MDLVKRKRNLLIYAAVFILFIMTAVFSGISHEAWADEAQAWLIARDNNSFLDIVRAVRYEGTVPSWHLIIKLFQILGLQYEHFFVISLIFSALGVILLFISDTPLYAKILLPFSYYVLYQDTVIARQYSMIFPAMMLMLIFFKEREKKPLGYFLGIIFLASTSSYGVILASSFLLWDLISIIKTIKTRRLDRFCSFFLATGAIMALIVLVCLPPADCNYPKINELSFADSLTCAFLFKIDSLYLQIAFIAVLLTAFIYCFRKNIVQVLIYTVPLLLYMIFFYHRPWHMPYLFFLIVILLVIFRNKDKETGSQKAKIANFSLKAFIITLLSFQVITGIYSIFLDYRYNYYPSKEIAKFIKPYIDAGAKADTVGYSTYSVQPYFDKNIYANNPTNKSYYIWSGKYDYFTLSSPPSDILIVPTNISVGNAERYNRYVFDGYNICKFSATNERQCTVYVLKSLEDKNG